MDTEVGVVRAITTIQRPRGDKLVASSNDMGIEVPRTPTRSAIPSGRLPTDRGFGEWFGIKPTWGEAG
jgi:hypothetical protein